MKPGYVTIEIIPRNQSLNNTKATNLYILFVTNFELYPLGLKNSFLTSVFKPNLQKVPTNIAVRLCTVLYLAFA